jgi:uncharacterized protein YcaQ
MQPSLDQLRRHAVARSLFPLTTLPDALTRLGFVQADPIRAPARAQDLTLRQRVRGYRSGDLERRYAQLAIEEDFFVNYGFVTRDLHRLMHPRAGFGRWTPARHRQAVDVLAFVTERGIVHPREVDAAFAHGRTRNWFGGTRNASTQLLDEMHHRGLLRVAGRASGVRLYAPAAPREAVLDPAAALDALVDVVVAKYAPLPQRSLAELVARLRHGAPQWQSQRAAALQRALRRLPQATVDGVRWLWAPGENPAAAGERVQSRVRLLAPFDPVVWDRRRFELLWGWAYRFEAYTPAAQRVRGYYALPLLWRDRVVGWGNLTWRDGRLGAQLGYVAGRAPREAGFGAALDCELDAIGRFLGATPR